MFSGASSAAEDSKTARHDTRTHAHTLTASIDRTPSNTLCRPQPDGTLAEYEAAFRAADESGNGSLGATELSEMFKQMGNPASPDKLVEIFMKVRSRVQLGANLLFRMLCVR